MQFKNVSIYVPPPKDDEPPKFDTTAFKIVKAILDARAELGFSKEENLICCIAYSSSELANASAKHSTVIAELTKTLPWDGNLKSLKFVRKELNDGTRISVGLRRPDGQSS